MDVEAIVEELAEMVAADQAMRRSDTFDLDADVDRRNTARMREIVDAIGWPTISEVGERGSFDAWLLVQHADHDVAFQRRCLELMKAAPAGEVSPANIAYLDDRVRTHEGRPQLYGTQGADRDPGPGWLEDPERLDERRAAMGLELYASYRERLGSSARPDGVAGELIDLLVRCTTREPGSVRIEPDDDAIASFTRLVEDIGWPSASKVGRFAANAAGELAKSTRDPALRRRWLGLMRAEERGQVNPMHIAQITDGFRLEEGLPQAYGTMFTGDEDGAMVPSPIADPDGLDERRRALGLGPFGIELERMRSLTAGKT